MELEERSKRDSIGKTQAGLLTNRLLGLAPSKIKASDENGANHECTPKEVPE